MQVSPGLFKYDPENGFDLNRRQFVAAWNTDGNLLLTTYEVADDLTTITQMNQLVGRSTRLRTDQSAILSRRRSLQR